MPRTDIHLDAMLRHLGAAYYESLHGRATRADVTRALNTVEEHLNEQTPPDGSTAGPGPTRHRVREHTAVPEADGRLRPRGWSRRVCDVMTTSVVTVDRITPVGPECGPARRPCSSGIAADVEHRQSRRHRRPTRRAGGIPGWDLAESALPAPTPPAQAAG